MSDLNPEPFRVWGAEAFLAREFPPKEPLVKDLVHRRDLVALGARRRHGKTSLLTHLAVALAIPASDFLGYEIPQARRSLLLVLEDDPGEYQEKLRTVIGGRDIGGRIRIVGRDDFLASGIPIDIQQIEFRQAISRETEEHQPDLIIIDNLAHVIGAEYNDPKRVHELMTFCYLLARTRNAAIILAAHPRKDDPEYPASLRDNPGRFFESIMGSSHFINSTGSLWGLERPSGTEYSNFLGGRQRGDGNQQVSLIQMNDNGWFELVPGGLENLQQVLNTEVRKGAWNLLPSHAHGFGYREGEDIVRTVMRSSSTYSAWMRECRRLGVIVDAPDGKLMKAPGLDAGGTNGVLDASLLEGVRRGGNGRGNRVSNENK